MIPVRRKATQPVSVHSHGAADALDWEEAVKLIESLYEDGKYRDSLLVAAGCYMGLRISDIRRLTWSDILSNDIVTICEKKTGKKRKIKINRRFKELTGKCHDMIQPKNDDSYILASTQYGGQVPITRNRADQILKECKNRYGIVSAKSFSCHSLRKTFGRRIYKRECELGRGEQALLLLQDVFGHSSIAITKRYLGIREDEILSVYDIIDS